MKSLLAHTDAVEHVASALVAGRRRRVVRSRLVPPPGSLGCGDSRSWIAGVARRSRPPRRRGWSSLAGRSFTGHMVQHLLVIVVAAPLLVMAEPWRTATRTVRVPTTAGRAARHSPTWHRGAPARRAGPVRRRAVRDPPHVDLRPHAGRPAAARGRARRVPAQCRRALVGGAQASGGPARAGAGGGGVRRDGGQCRPRIDPDVGARPVDADLRARDSAQDALDDQRTAAAIMWVGGMLATTPLLVLAFWRWAATEDRIARRAEALTDAATAMTKRPRRSGHRCCQRRYADEAPARPGDGCCQHPREPKIRCEKVAPDRRAETGAAVSGQSRWPLSAAGSGPRRGRR